MEKAHCIVNLISEHDLDDECILKELNLLDAELLVRKFEPQGMSAILLDDHKHITIHTWPENKAACLDIYGFENPEVILAKLILLYKPTYFESRSVIRGSCESSS